MNRPNKDEYYLEIAKAVSKRSPCIRRRYGAIIVVNDAIVSTGYNGPARGVINCIEVGCIKNILKLPHGKAYDYCPAVHAEENTVVNAARNGSKISNGILYIYGEDAETGEEVEATPCNRCKRILINAGVEKVVIKTKEGFKILDVKSWIREDTESYLGLLEEVKKTEK
ncbi:MAG: dCMP deaminase family protein [Candidatus Aenigmarchaeota archaeon]|nr:dCMP deaminase family protein [Candidatus Aenigmarchaeota archaeon]MCX8191113.1 dCMP deaminase family protein [Candidatus Aenigmarchaeota archaeon]MDW8160337.1 dCMP deaminase family protein [Candidatus Aenigmarchaeota archaeon]